MNSDYLSRLLLLTELERRQLRMIGAPTPVALLSAIEASHEDFARMLGEDGLRALKSALETMLPAHEKALLRKGPPPLYSLGANLEHSQVSIGQTDFTKKRDRIYDEIQQLRGSRNQSPQATRRLQDLEQELNELCDEDAA